MEPPQKPDGWWTRLTRMWLGKSPDRQVAVILATGVAASIFVLTLGVSVAEIDHQSTVTQETFTVVVSVLTAIIGALSVYLGQGRRRSDNDQNNDKEKTRN